MDDAGSSVPLAVHIACHQAEELYEGNKVLLSNLLVIFNTMHVTISSLSLKIHPFHFVHEHFSNRLRRYFLVDYSWQTLSYHELTTSKLRWFSIDFHESLQHFSRWFFNWHQFWNVLGMNLKNLLSTLKSRCKKSLMVSASVHSKCGRFSRDCELIWCKKEEFRNDVTDVRNFDSILTDMVLWLRNCQKF